MSTSSPKIVIQSGAEGSRHDRTPLTPIRRPLNSAASELAPAQYKVVVIHQPETATA